MTNLNKNQRIVRIIMFTEKIMIILHIIVIILGIVIIRSGNNEAYFNFASYRLLVSIMVLLYAIPNAWANKICTCKRCGYKMTRKEFLGKTDLLCPNGHNHNII